MILDLSDPWPNWEPVKRLNEWAIWSRCEVQEMVTCLEYPGCQRVDDLPQKGGTVFVFYVIIFFCGAFRTFITTWDSIMTWIKDSICKCKWVIMRWYNLWCTYVCNVLRFLLWYIIEFLEEYYVREWIFYSLLEWLLYNIKDSQGQDGRPFSFLRKYRFCILCEHFLSLVEHLEHSSQHRIAFWIEILLR